MKVRVKLHATLKKHLPTQTDGTAVLDLPEGASVADLIAHLKIPDKHAGMMVSGDEYLETTSVLREGQEVNLFPPLAGGMASPDSKGGEVSDQLRSWGISIRNRGIAWKGRGRWNGARHQ